MTSAQTATRRKRNAGRKRRIRGTPRPPSGGVPGLRFSPYAWAKLLYLRNYGSTEVGGFGISNGDDLLLIDDIRLVWQRCSSVSVQFDDVEPPGAHYSETLLQWRPGYGTAEYKRIVPMGTIPAIVVLEQDSDRPFVLSESSTICEWIEVLRCAACARLCSSV